MKSIKRLFVVVFCLFAYSTLFAEQSILEQIKNLQKQKLNGSITEQEFQKRRSAILDARKAEQRADEEARIVVEKQKQEKEFEAEKNNRLTVLLSMFKRIRQPNLAEVKQAIAQGADVNAVEASGESVLMLAAANCNDPDIIRLLVSKGADVNTVVNSPEMSESVLSRADYNSNPAIKNVLVELGASYLIERKTYPKYHSNLNEEAKKWFDGLPLDEKAAVAEMIYMCK